MIHKLPKQKQCKNCKEKFVPTRPLQQVCGYKCAVAKVKKDGEVKRSTKIEKSISEQKKDLLTNDGYRKKYVQPVINEIARLIDFERPCIATGNYGKMSGGHYFSTGSNRTLTYNLHNIHAQSFESNVHRSGDPIKYRNGIIETYGNDYFYFVESLQKTPPLHLTRTDLEEIFKTAKQIRLRLKKEPRKYDTIERLELRNEINLELGIYSKEFGIFTY